MKIKTNQLQAGDVLLYEGKAFISFLIRVFDGTKYSHAGLYTSNNKVIEALGKGVIENSFEKSFKKKKIHVLRLKDRPYNMTPVITKGKEYLGTRYAFEQLLLLLFITTSRRVRSNFLLLRLVNKIITAGSKMLLQLTNGNKEALICSELVYRSYNEALPNPIDAYTIELEGDAKIELLAINNRSKELGFKKGSLMDMAYGSGARLSTFKENVFSPFVEEKNCIITDDFRKEAKDFTIDQKFENELEALYKDVIESYKNEDYSMDEKEEVLFKANMDRFISLYHDAKAQDNKTLDINVASITKFDTYFNDYGNGDFVTPGDLSKATNLLNLGELDF